MYTWIDRLITLVEPAHIVTRGFNLHVRQTDKVLDQTTVTSPTVTNSNTCMYVYNSSKHEQTFKTK